MDVTPTLVVFEDDVSRFKALSILGKELTKFHRFATCGDFRQLFALLWDGPDRLLGGLLGSTHSGWLHVEFIWVEEAARRQGYGSRLLIAAEQEALARGCQRAYLDSVGTPALDFFHLHGYVVCGELIEFTPGQNRYWLHKSQL